MEQLECIDSDELMQEIRDQAEGKPDPGDASINICFSTTDSLLSRWIRGYTGSLVSHSLITFRDRTLNRVMVMQASGHGYQVIPWARWEKDNILVARFRFPNDVVERCQVYALRAIARRIGDGYDARGLFGFIPVLWYRFLKWLPSPFRAGHKAHGSGGEERPWLPRFRNWLDNPKKLFCSEAVVEFLAYANPSWRKRFFQRPQDWSPENLLGFASDATDGLVAIAKQDQGPTVDRQLTLSKRYRRRLRKSYPEIELPKSK